MVEIELTICEQAQEILDNIINKPKLIVMCGIQCSGKSTEAKKLAEQYNAVIISSDNFRQTFPEEDNSKIFKRVYDEMDSRLKHNTNVIIDATNTTIKMRRQLFSNIRENCYKICYVMNTYYDDCLTRLRERNKSDYPHKVPEEVLKKYYYNFEIPFYEEGWDEIHLVNHPTMTDTVFNLHNLRSATEGFNQNNKHHTQDLNQHLFNTKHCVEKISKNTILSEAAHYHDVGKLFTQVYKPNDPDAHYYNHANVGAYILMCCAGIHDDLHEFDEKSTLEWLFYVNYHMVKYNLKTDKAIKKWSKIFGKEKFDNLLLLNYADSQRPEIVCLDGGVKNDM